jgi:hypothetical protein
MSQKINLPVRISPVLLQRIKAKKSGIEETLFAVLDALDREENMAFTMSENFEKLSDRMGQMEGGFISLVAQIREFLPLVIEAENASYRGYNSSRLMLAWGDLVVKTGGMPSVEQWEKEREEVLKEAVEKRKIQLEKRGQSK